MTYTPIVIVGAGPAGIAAAVSLRDRSLNSVIVDRADQVATSWRGRYEKLKLNTSKYFSHLPRRRYPPGTPMFPTRSEVADYFEGHARQSGIALQLSTNVMRIDPEPNGWRLATSSGDMRANHVVVATGFENTPHIPEWPGITLFYRVVRHPLNFGFIVAFWAAPTMTAGRLLFAAVTTGWIVIAMYLEEHDQLAALGARFAAYRQSVRMIVPGLPMRSKIPQDSLRTPDA
jgi:thioredoxin reductase